MKTNSVSCLALLFLVMAFNIGTLNSQDKSEWSSFHGLNRMNKSNETGLLNSWSQNGPELLWTISGLGEGYTSVSIGGGLLYSAGKSENQTYVFAYDLNGKLVWKKPNGEAWTVKLSWASSYNGPRSTPTYDNGVVYHLSEAGKLTAYKSKTGETPIKKDVHADAIGAILRLPENGEEK